VQIVKLTIYINPEIESPYTLTKRYYRVFTGSSSFYFKSERTLNLWFGEVNRNLNAMVSEINSIYIAVFQEYRYYYLHYDSSQRFKFDNRFASINKAFDLLTTRCNGCSDNSRVYHHFNVILKQLAAIVEELSEHPMNKTATVQRYRLAATETRIQFSTDRLKQFPEGYCKRKDYDR